MNRVTNKTLTVFKKTINCDRVVITPCLNVSDVLEAIGLITTAVGNGKISPSEGEALSRIIDVHVKVIEAYDYEKRLEKLEERKIQCNYQ